MPKTLSIFKSSGFEASQYGGVTLVSLRRTISMMEIQIVLDKHDVKATMRRLNCTTIMVRATN